MKEIKSILQNADSFSLVPEQGFQRLQALPTAGLASKNILLILKRSMAFMICIQAVFILTKLLKKTGLTGAVT